MSWIDTVESTLSEAWSGNLSAYDKQQILDNSNIAIAKAGAGLEPGIVAFQQEAATKDINKALNSFCNVGEVSTECGAQPNSALRLPGIGPLTLENVSQKIGIGETYLKWGLITVGALALVFFGFPYIAPQIGANLSAARKLKK